MRLLRRSSSQWLFINSIFFSPPNDMPMKWLQRNDDAWKHIAGIITLISLFKQRMFTGNEKRF
jgi:hypothetical protein